MFTNRNATKKQTLSFFLLGSIWTAKTVAFTAIPSTKNKLVHYPSSKRPTATIATTITTTRLSEKNNDKIVDFWKTFPNWSNEPSTTTSSNSISTTTPENTSGLLQTIEVVTGPVQEILDVYSAGWALSYADLKPDTSETIRGKVFLATNLAYLLVGLVLQYQGANELGLATDLCAAFSFQYHYQQLEATNTVRAALLLDYIFAALAMGLATFYLIMSLTVTTILTTNVAIAIGLAVLSLGCLGLSWKYEYGQPYMFWHGLWHLASAGAGYAIGDLHTTLM